MNRTLPLFHVAAAASASLSGGQAPRSWRRECALRATRLRALNRAAFWRDALCARAPGLTETPLWGERLAELATQTPARNADAAAPPRPPGVAPRADARAHARPAHPPGEFTHARHQIDHARHQTSPRRTSAAGATLSPPLPRAFQQHAASVPKHDPRLSDVNRSEHDLRPSGVNRSAPGSREQTGEEQGAYCDVERNNHTLSARAAFNSSEVSTSPKGFPSSARADVETNENGEAFVTGVEMLSRRASRELLSRLAGQNGASPVQNQKHARIVPAKDSGAAASAEYRTAVSKNYGAAPSLAEERRADRAHTRSKTTPRATTTRSPIKPEQQPSNSRHDHTPDAPGSRGDRVRLAAAASHSRSRQRWSALAARISRVLRRPGALPSVAEQTGALTAVSGEMGAPLLTRQLFFTVNGETAPQDLLMRLAGVSVAASGAARQHVKQGGGSSGRQSPAPRSPRGETPQTFFEASSNNSTNGGGSVALPHQSPGQGFDAKQLQASAKAEASAPGVNTSLLSVNNYLSGAENTLPGAAASPILAESLPPLLPSPLVGMPILPIALATAREGARDESRESAEDLDALAEKIKFILDEQARRHGIDV